MHSFGTPDLYTSEEEKLPAQTNAPSTIENKSISDEAGAKSKRQEVDIDEYLVDDQEQQKLNDILNLLESFNARGINLAIGGGYGLDGLYGKLTQPHKDLDLLAKHDDLLKIDTLLEFAGYMKTQEDPNKHVYQHPQAPGFEIEIGDADVLVQKFGLGEGLLDTKQANATIGDRSLNVLPLDLHKAIIDLQNARAEQTNWGEYDAAKRQNQAEIIKRVEARLNQQSKTSTDGPVG